MKRRLTLQWAIFFGLTGLMAALAVLSFVNALSWIKRPFAGFLLYDFPYVASMGSREWPGGNLGLRFLDRIVTVDGHPVFRGRDVVKALETRAPDTVVTYSVRTRDGKEGEFRVPVVRFGMKDFVLVFLVPFLGGLAIYIIGVVAYALKPGTASSWVFTFLCFTLGTYIVTGFEMQSSYWTVKLHYLIIPLFPAAFFHLGLIFPEKKLWAARSRWIPFLIYVPAMALVVAYQGYLMTFEQGLRGTGPSWGGPGYQDLATLNRYYTLFCVVSLVGFVLHASFWGRGSTVRQRARLILFGVTIAFLPAAVITFVVVRLNINFPWNFLIFFVIFFPASIAYSIVRHNLFEADVIIQRAVGYALVTGFVIGAYAGVSVILNVALGNYGLAQSQAFPILFTLGVIFVFNPVRDRIQAVVDRIFFRKDYDPHAIMEKMGKSLTSLLDLKEILVRFIHAFVEEMFVSTSTILLLRAGEARYGVEMAGGEGGEGLLALRFERQDPLFQVLEAKRHLVTMSDVLEDPAYREISSACAGDFERLNAAMMVPLVFQDEVIGALGLGEKKSGKPYNRDDVELIRTLANQGALAINNARLFQENLEKQRLEEEFAIARDIQKSMLPAECPQIPGYEIAQHSTPAKEVGGDFHDFIELPGERLAIVVGDVTGKGLSGAMVMAASRSLFRALSEDETSIGDLMIRANRRTKKDIKSGLFLALLYAVIDTRTGGVAFSSAGQTQPIHYSYGTGKAVLIDPKGDNFPLGILDDVTYEDTVFPMEKGDRLILYSDGIVEAMNAEEEMFGFERLLQTIEETGLGSAEEVLGSILERVDVFVGKAPQHDDITCIVIGVAGAGGARVSDPGRGEEEPLSLPNVEVES